MRLGIIDLGTNSVRFDVQWIGPRQKVRLLHREKIMVRLGHGVFLRQRLDPSAKRRTVEALLSFKKIASRFQVSKFIAFGTSALREAVDAELFVQHVLKRTGIEIRVISGEEEARLIALGILTHERKPRGLFGLVDVGGGSTEVSLCRGSTLLQSCSFQLGTARLQQVFLQYHPPRLSRGEQLIAIENLRKHIRSTIANQTQGQPWSQVPILMGSSGTIRAIERVLKKLHNTDGIERSQLQALIRQMTGKSRNELLKIPGMESKRVDMILSGAILLDEQMDFFGANQLKTTRYSLRDGILAREILLQSHQKDAESRFQLDELYRKATQFGFAPSALRAKVATAETLFRGTRKLHQLDEEWLRYLTAAMILHEIGTAISPTHFEAHSYYIVRHADFLAMETWESEWIAQLCLRANLTSLAKKDLNFLKNKKERTIFLKLLALIHIAEAIGTKGAQKPSIQSLAIRNHKLKITLSSHLNHDLTALRIQQKKDHFEKVFRCSVLVETVRKGR